MRIREAVVSLPLHPGGLNNNQLRRSEQNQPISEEIENRNDISLTNAASVTRSSSSTDFILEDNDDFRVAEDTTTWSSLAITRENVQIDTSNENVNDNDNDNESLNNNLTSPGIHRNSSDESLTDYEGRNSSREDSFHEWTPPDWSGCSEERSPLSGWRGIVNPNYLGFQHLKPSQLWPTHLNEDELDYPWLNDFDTRLTEEDNYLCVQENEKKNFYKKPYIIPTPPSCDSESLKEESIADEAKTEEKVSEKSDVINEGVEAEPYLKAWKKILVDGVVKGWELSLGDEETLLDPVTENSTELSTTKLEEKQEREVPVEIEIVELTTSVKETLQFPEIEEIPDSGKTSEVGETEDIVVEHIDLIREAKELPHQARSKIGNRQTITSNGSADDDSESNTDTDSYPEEQPTYTKLEEIDLLSSIGRDIGVDLEKYVQPVPDVVAMEAMDPVHASSRSSLNMMKDNIEDTNKLLDRDLPEASSADTRKKEKMARNQAKRRQQQQQQQLRSSNAHRRPDKRRADVDNGPGGFDVYNIETAMPKIDLDAIESHLRAAREEERRRRNDREEIRRRLAMGPDAEDLRAERGRKPSLQSRLQSGMNLQICFMNETPSDTESPCSENDVSPESTPTSLGSKQQHHQQQQKQQMPVRPQVLSLPSLRLETGSSSAPIDEADFFAKQARLQTEARMALAQAKEMAHMQMEVERQRLKQSPITEMVRSSLEKVGVQLGEDRRRLSRVLLTDLNVAQLQVVANDLHARIAALNEALVEGLLRRDDLHMEQDSMLVDVEDLTRYLFCCVHMHRGAKQESLKKKQNAREQQAASRSHQQTSTGPNKSSLKPKLTHRGFVSLVRK
ncbi:schwannomin interacting protein 1 isoform X4 [Megachile rotundata]|uniref:schwannomin interacting protein 1 isoform X4 n=1 Tax=Megachile rotundata TaxID=143995 RepID=UPI003FD09936